MSSRTISIVLVTAVALVGLASAQPTYTPPQTDKEKIANAMSAAPNAVAQQATIVDIDGQGKRRVLRKGQGVFTCMPDNPTSPGNDPMCLDKAGMEWAHAWMTKGTPPPGVGFAYMLMGGSDASNDDPYATKPAAGMKWVQTGAHIMVLNPGAMADAYPKSAEDPKKPYVMWAGTPYRHLMIPVK